jgi:hypothetical protein
MNDLARWLSKSNWRGRERELISLFAFGYLQRHCKPRTVLRDPTQIGIEVAVPQLPRRGAKAVVCKDLVIWPKPAMTVWDADRKPSHDPLAILEWKVGQKKGRPADIDWLSAYSAHRPDFVGFSVFCALGPPVVLDVALVRLGQVSHGWLPLPHRKDRRAEE